jgi:hypothetical protein
MGWIMSPLRLVGTLTFLNLRLVRLLYSDSIVLQICKNQLGVKLSLKDIGRSHPIGQSRDGKISIIVRFLSYRQRAMVFSNKKKLKGNIREPRARLSTSSRFLTTLVPECSLFFTMMEPS